MPNASFGPLVSIFFSFEFYYIQIRMGWFREGRNDENGFKNKFSIIEYFFFFCSLVIHYFDVDLRTHICHATRWPTLTSKQLINYRLSLTWAGDSTYSSLNVDKRSHLPCILLQSCDKPYCFCSENLFISGV